MLEKNVAGNLKYNVWYEEDYQTNVVLIGFQIELGREAKDVGIGNVYTTTG